MTTSDTSPAGFVGPVLILDTIRDSKMSLAALVLCADGSTPPDVGAPDGAAPFALLATFGDLAVWRARFDVPADRASAYRWNGTNYPLASDLTGDLRLAYVSCNGEEHGDMDRDPDERNVMWGRLFDDHRAAPFALLMHGGDQVYADEATDGHPMTEDWPTLRDKAPSKAALADLTAHLRQRFAARYAALYAQKGFADLAARVPSVMQWDDHDICDGWGSLRPNVINSAVGQTLFSVAREAALVFQHGCSDGDLPARFEDADGGHLGWEIATPGLRILAPDLRSERSFTQVMGLNGWKFMTRAARDVVPGRTLILSSVPLLGPRLSVVEKLMRFLPGIQKYEDDLRDQWQSRAHRASWVRMLSLVREMAQDDGADVTALSGEIHLATRAEMGIGAGKMLHQLVASGITHRPPPATWARVLGSLAAWGEDPVPDAPVRIYPLPGRRHRYTEERNALVLERRADRWTAAWELEHAGRTPDLPL